MTKIKQQLNLSNRFTFLLKVLFVICAIIGGISLFGTLVGTTIPFIMEATVAAIPFLIIIAIGYLVYKLLRGRKN